MFNLIAHRGNNNHMYAENSLEAILSSLDESYINGVEFDVRLTKDNQLVVIHDFTINRTSNGHGIVKNLTLKELRQYTFGNKSHTYKIFTLNDILKSIKSNKIIIIELKNEVGSIELIVKKVVRIIKKYKNLNIYLTSFSKKITYYIKKNYPIYNVGLAPMFITKNYNFDEQYDAYFINYNFFKKYKTIKPLFFWTVNDINFFKNKIKLISKTMFFITDKAYLIGQKYKSINFD